MVVRYCLDVPGSVVVAAKMARFLQHHIVDPDLNTWSIYDWEDFSNVPQAWRDTVNSLYDSE